MEEKKEKSGSVYTLENFSSTVKLTDKEFKPPLGSNGTISEKDGLYNPFDERSVDYPNSDVGSFIHLLKSSLGTGILAMPSAFKNGGLLVAGIGTFLIGFICTHCIHILVKCSYELCIKAKKPSMGFAEIAGAAFTYGPERLRRFSPVARAFADVGLVLTYTAGLCVYVVFIAASIDKVVQVYSPTLQWDTRYYMAIAFVFLAVICQVRELKYLVPFSMIANVLMGLALVITLYYVFTALPNTTLSERKLVSSFQQLPLFLSTVIFAMEGIGVVMPVENEMKNPHHFLGCPGVLNMAMGTVVTLYALIGFFGYLCYGEDTKATVTLSLDAKEIPAQVVNISIAGAIFFTYALQFYVPIDITWNKVVAPRVSEKYHNFFQVILRILIVGLTVVVAALVDNLEPFISFVGAVFLSVLGLFVPAVVETVVFWDTDLGRGNWKLWKNIGLALLSMVALISGSYTSLKIIIEGEQK